MKYDLDLIKELFATRKFLSLDALKASNKKVYALTGAKATWKKEPDVVYSYQLRVTGTNKQFAEFLNGLEPSLLDDLSQIEDAHVSKATKKSLQTALITSKNYEKAGKSSVLYQYELEKYDLLKVEAKKKPTIEAVYEAFLEYKKTKNDIKPQKAAVKLESIGQTYQDLDVDEVLNVFDYASKEPKLSVDKVKNPDENVFEIGGKRMYRVPNYRLVSSKKADIQTALQDLMSLDVIELKKKDLTKLLNDWSRLKKGPVKKRVKSPAKLGNTNGEMPQSVKQKINIVKE